MIKTSIAVLAVAALCTGTALLSLPKNTSHVTPIVTKSQSISMSKVNVAAAVAELPAGLAVAISRDLGISSADYVKDSAAAKDAVDTVAALTKTGIPVLGSRMDGQKLTVFVPSQSYAAAVEATGAAAHVGSPPASDISGIKFSSAGTVYGGTGIYWQQANGNGWQCSAGYNGFSISSGGNQLLTAGHCVASMDANNAVYELTQSNGPGSGGSRGNQLGTALNSSGHFGNGKDSGLINVAGVTPAAAIATWGNSNGPAMSTAPTSVTGESAAIVNANICKSGSRSGWSCGPITAVDRDVSVNDAGTIYTVNSIIANVCVLPGDSGGAALIGSNAVGVTSASNASTTCNSNSFAAFFPMVSAAGKSDVRSTYSGTWEPKIAVSAPVIAQQKDGTSTKPGTITGTLANPDRSSQIRLYIDGSSSVSVTASAATGNWSITLPTAKAGTHSFTLVASWGTWSSSSATSGTTTVTDAPTPSPTPTPTASPTASPTTKPSGTPKPTPTSTTRRSVVGGVLGFFG